MKLIAPHPDTQVAIHEHYSFRPLLSKHESQLYAHLHEATKDRCQIVCKPRLADFIQHQQGPTTFNNIGQKHVDFLICRNQDWIPMLAIELEDPAQGVTDRHKQDTFINELFTYVGIPLLRLHVSELTLVDHILKQLETAWNRRCVSLSQKFDSAVAA